MALDRDTVVRMSPALCDDQVDDFIEKRTPELTFNSTIYIRQVLKAVEFFKRFTNDAELVRAATTLIQPWRQVLERYLVRVNLSVPIVIQQLVTIAPDRQPLESKLYSTVKKRLEKVE
ncbi:hypothetical protein F5Y12DRAFT_713649 [Xylaria sp. FL1777]|nr:hypothetical protein F5Y12DRAFT_713649 [Xylaria sp. FL1777]